MTNLSDMETPAAPGAWLAPIYAAWGGNASAMAADIGEQPVTTNQWRYRGRIPESYWETIIVKAAERGTTLSHRDFIKPEFRSSALPPARPERRLATAAPPG